MKAAKSADYRRTWRLEHKKNSEKTGLLFLICCICTVNIITLSIGLMLGWSSPVLPKLQAANSPLGSPISPTNAAWLGSLLPIGAIFSPFTAAYFAEREGRKIALLGISIPLLIAFIILSTSHDIWMYHLSRVLAGVSAGGVFAVLPTYVSEISDDTNRGVNGSMMNVFITAGLLLAYTIGPYLSVSVFSGICAAITASFLVLFGLFMPETPQFLSSRGRHREAREVLKRLRGAHAIVTIVDEEIDLEKTISGSILNLFTIKSNVNALIIAVGLVVLQQLSGINVIAFYGESIFERIGDGVAPEVPPMIIGGVQVFASWLTPLVVDRWGRRVLLGISSAGMFASEMMLGVFLYFEVSGVEWLPVAATVIYVFMFGVAFGPLPWMIMAEIFPSDVKTAANAIAASCCWLACFLLTRFFLDVEEVIGMGGAFLGFAGVSLFAFGFVLIYVPETKGKKLAEIQELLSK